VVIRSILVIVFTLIACAIVAAPASAATVSRSFAVTAEVPCSFTVPKTVSAPQTLACNGVQSHGGVNPVVQRTRDKDSGQYFLTVQF